MINLLNDLQDRLGLAYLFIAHDLSVVRHVADRIAVMYLGRIVEQGTAEEVYRGPRHPYTEALLSAIPVPDPANSATRSASCCGATSRARSRRRRAVISAPAARTRWTSAARKIPRCSSRRVERRWRAICTSPVRSSPVLPSRVSPPQLRAPDGEANRPSGRTKGEQDDQAATPDPRARAGDAGARGMRSSGGSKSSDTTTTKPKSTSTTTKAPAQTVTITPSTGLTDGQTVTVVGKGYTPGAQNIGANECADKGDRTRPATATSVGPRPPSRTRRGRSRSSSSRRRARSARTRSSAPGDTSA